MRSFSGKAPMAENLDQHKDRSAPPHAAHRKLQFRLRHLFLSLTSVALVCGLATWLGPPGLILVCGPLVTWIVLNRTDGDCPWHAVVLAASVQALLIACLLFMESVLNPICAMGSLAHRTRTLLISLIFGVAGGVLSILISIPFLALWYALRSLRRVFPGRDETPTSDPPETGP